MGNQKPDIRPDPERRAQRSALGLTAVCMASSLVTLVWYLAGPQSGMETLGIIIPLMISGGMHVFLGLPALVLALQSGALLRNTWIYAYFIGMALFFGGLTGVNVTLEKKFDRRFNSEEYELYQILEPMALLNRTTQNEDTAGIRRALALVNQGADPDYVFPGDRRSLAVLAVSADLPEVARLMLKENPGLANDPRTLQAMMRKAIYFGRAATIEVLLDSGGRFPLSDYKNDFKSSPGFQYHPERLPEMYLRFQEPSVSRDDPASNSTGL